MCEVGRCPDRGTEEEGGRTQGDSPDGLCCLNPEAKGLLRMGLGKGMNRELWAGSRAKAPSSWPAGKSQSLTPQTAAGDRAEGCHRGDHGNQGPMLLQKHLLTSPHGPLQASPVVSHSVGPSPKSAG